MGETTSALAGGAGDKSQGYLDDLRESLVKTAAVCGAVVAHVWLAWNFYELEFGLATIRSAPAPAWLGSVILWLGVATAYVLARRHPLGAARLLVWSITATIVCALQAFAAPGLIYLFVVPIVLASAVVDRTTFFASALIAGLFAVAFDPSGAAVPVRDRAILTLVIAATTLSTWLASQALDTVLTWVWGAYERALKNEALAREHQGKLNRTLRALDEAQYRLERNNHLLALARNEAERARQVKQEFAQAISHELRTPLNLIIGFSEIMANDPETYGDMAWPANLRGDVQQIHHSSRHLAALIDDILDLSALEARRMRLVLQEVNIRQVIEDAVSVVDSLFQRKGLYLRLDVAQDLPPLSLDPLRVRQVLLNLLSNASRHTDRGGVTITTRLVDGYVQVSVTDTGTGIAPEQLDRVFEEFSEVCRSTQRSGEGTGLGLALSKRFVELHGGSMWLESTLNQGTTAHFTLPAPSETRRALTGDLTRTPDRAVPQGTPHPKMLLVAGAGPLQLATLRRLDGCDIVRVTKLGDLSSLVERHQPAALVVNSEGSDLPVTTQTWSACVPPDLPIIALPLQDRFTSPEPLNVHEFLLKPVARERLLQAIDSLHRELETILIVDDDLQLVELLSRMLESAGRGWRTIKSFCGQEALNRMFREPPDLVLLDLALPQVDGLTVLETMRANRPLEGIPVIVISAHEHLEMIEGGHMLSVTRGKRFSNTELLTYLSILMSGQSPGAVAPAPAQAPPAALAAARAF